MAKERAESSEERARRRAEYLAGLLWHLGAFVIVNIFFWSLDAYGPTSVEWAFWITAGWGFGVAFHVLAYLIDGRQLEDRKTQEYVDAELKREEETSRSS